MTNDLVFKLNSDKSVVCNKNSAERIVELHVKAPEKKADVSRVPLNLALVIDRSGSMSGQKLEFARQAAIHVVDLLDKNDRLALVAFDDQVNRIFPPVRLTEKNRADLREAIQKITSGGSTNLSGGWLTGCHEIAETQVENGLNRALLLTDGCANAGIVDPVELGYHASQLNERGISTTTLGVGLDFDHFLLERMSEMGGGNYYFIEDSRTIPEIFQRELHELIHITARAVEIVIKNPSGTKVEVAGGWRTRIDNTDTHIMLGDLASGLEKRIYLRFLVSPGLDQDTITLPAVLRARDENDQIIEVSISFDFACVSKKEEAQAKMDEELLRRFAEIDNADAAHEAMLLERAGHRSKARDLLHQRTTGNAPYLSDVKISEYENLADRMNRGMDEQDRKSTHYNANLQRKVRGS